MGEVRFGTRWSGTSLLTDMGAKTSARVAFKCGAEDETSVAERFDVSGTGELAVVCAENEDERAGAEKTSSSMTRSPSKSTIAEAGLASAEELPEPQSRPRSRCQC